MAFVTAIGDVFSFVTAIADTNVSNGCDNGAVTNFICIADRIIHM